jgi:hypothetical protein
MVRDAIEMASISEPDEYAGLPDREELASGDRGPNLQLYDERIDTLTRQEAQRPLVHGRTRPAPPRGR